MPLKNGAAMKVAYQGLMGLLQKSLEPPQKPESEEEETPSVDLSNFSPRIAQFEFEGQVVYCLNCGTAAPSWCLTDRELVFGLLPQDIKAYLARRNHEPLGSDAHVAGLLAGEHGPSFMSYWNPRAIFRFAYSWMLMYRTVDLEQPSPVQSRCRPFDVPLAAGDRSPYRPQHGHRAAHSAGHRVRQRGTIPLPADAATVIAMCVMSQYGSLVNFSNSPFQSSVEPPAVVQPANQEPAAQDPNGQQPGGQEACPQQDSPPGKQNDGSGK